MSAARSPQYSEVPPRIREQGDRGQASSASNVRASRRSHFVTVAGDHLEALYTAALALGLRLGEALGLRWQDIDLDGATLMVSGQLQRVKGQAYNGCRARHRAAGGRSPCRLPS